MLSRVILLQCNLHGVPACRDGLRLGFRLSDLWWPCSVDDALSKGLVQLLEDGKLALSTEDSAGRIVLHQHRRRFAICYPLLTQEHPQEGSYEYVWQTQVRCHCAAAPLPPPPSALFPPAPPLVPLATTCSVLHTFDLLTLAGVLRTSLLHGWLPGLHVRTTWVSLVA